MVCTLRHQRTYHIVNIVIHMNLTCEWNLITVYVEIFTVCNFRGWSINSENLVSENLQPSIYL